MINKEIIKKTIILLTILLTLSLIFLCIIIIHNFNNNDSVIHNNTITTCTSDNLLNSFNTINYANSNNDINIINTVRNDNNVQNFQFSLNNKHTDANTSFKIENMFPGDKYEKYYDMTLSQNDTVTINFISETSKKIGDLEKVLNCKFENIDNGQVIYDGTIENLHNGILYSVSPSKSSISELHYKMTIYLDESVGNDFQQNYLDENLMWRVQNKDALAPSPLTGDNTKIVLFITLFVIAIMCIILLFVLKRRRANNEKNIK